MIENVNVIGHGRVGSALAARLAERGLDARPTEPGPRPALRPRPGDRRGRCRGRPGPVGRARQRSDAARGARSAHAALRRASSADVHATARAGAARRRLGGRDGRERRGARRRDLARRDARAPPLSPPRRESRRLPRRRGDRLELPRHAPPRGRVAARGGGRAARGARSPDAADDRERLRAHRPDPARRLGDGRAPPGGDPASCPELEALYRVLADATVAVA